MSKVIQCDCCKRVTPEIDPTYSTKKRIRWMEYLFDSQGGSYTEQHLCKACWNNIGECVKGGS